MGVSMGSFIDRTGHRFGRLTVLERAENKGKHTCWLCLCDCGKTTVVFATALKAGLTVSCGCYNIEKIRDRSQTHGMTKTRLYREYSSMKRRCTNANSSDYLNYGGRGITVCEEWMTSFMAFQKWALSNGYRDDLTLDRIEVNGNYEPGNCRWITNDEQANNKRCSRLLTHKGMTLTVAQWSKITGISRYTLYGRLNAGWSAEKALTTPPRR